MKRLISSRNIKVVLAIVLAITCINGIGLNLNDHPIQVPDGTSSSQSKTTSTSSIPDYTGLASVVLSDGSGLDISDLPSETVLTELDSLGRCGAMRTGSSARLISPRRSMRPDSSPRTRRSSARTPVGVCRKNSTSGSARGAAGLHPSPSSCSEW